MPLCRFAGIDSVDAAGVVDETCSATLLSQRKALAVIRALGCALAGVLVLQLPGVIDMTEPDQVSELVIDDGLGDGGVTGVEGSRLS